MTAPPSQLISVVLPTYNRSNSIVPSVQSVLRQSWTDLELIIVDDGSEDDTVDVVRQIDDPRIKLVCMEQNSGPSAARNRGIKEARGEWVAFQDSDDEWLPNKLANQMVRIAKMGPSCIAAYCGMAVENPPQENGEPRTTVRYVPPSTTQRTEGNIVDTLFATSTVSTQTLIARRDALHDAGYFDETLQALEDWDLSIRLADRGDFAFVDQILVIQRFSDNSITRDRRKWAKARARMIAKHVERLQTKPEILSQQYRVLAGEYRREGMFEEAIEAMRAARQAAPGNLSLWLLDMHLRIKRLTS